MVLAARKMAKLMMQMAKFARYSHRHSSVYILFTIVCAILYIYVCGGI